jgi:hypothetical protein
MDRSSIVQLGCTRRSLPKDEFKRKVKKELTGRESEAWVIYFKLYKSQIPVIEQPMETAALMLGYLQRRRFCVGWRTLGADVEMSSQTGKP